MTDAEFFIDPSRCIGCHACVYACMECDTHRGRPLIHLEIVDRATTTQTSPVICMHCEDPVCAHVCPADAIKQTPEGIVQSALKPRCIGCSNCVLACPFGVPRYIVATDQMMKCDMCFDRTSAGMKPMCASVCPSEALYFGPRAHIERNRREEPVRDFQFGSQLVRTKVNLMTAPRTEIFEFDIVKFMPAQEDENGSTAFTTGDVAASSVWNGQHATRPAPAGAPVTPPERKALVACTESPP